jgi:hypothetical protein
MSGLNKTKTYTVEKANACLPLVRAIVADMVHLSRDLHERRHRLELLASSRNKTPGDPYADEVEHIREELTKDVERLEEYSQEIVDLGAIPRHPTEGLVDFPAVLDGREVYLCWKYNEPEILFWHDRDAGFAGRQPLTVGSACQEDWMEGSGESAP